MGSPPIFDSDDIKDSWRRIERGGENGFYFFNVLSLLSAFLNGTGGRKVGTSRLEREYRLFYFKCASRILHTPKILHALKKLIRQIATRRTNERTRKPPSH